MPDTEFHQITEAMPSAGEVVDLPSGTAATEAVPYEPRVLTRQEDNFALAVIEYGGNLAMAYKSVFGEDSYAPTAKARALLALPEIALRIKDLTDSVQENALISLGSHLVELATIRDLAKVQGNLKVALNAEESRGKVAGFYVGKSDNSSPKVPQGGTMVMVAVTTHHDRSI